MSTNTGTNKNSAKNGRNKKSANTGTGKGTADKSSSNKTSTNLIERVTLKRAAEKNWIKKFDDFSTGDTISVHVSIKEGEKERVQIYKGVVIKIQGSGLGKTFTVRKISSGVGVERTFPFSSPKIEKIEVFNRGFVRRSRLYFLRNLAGRAARLNSELVLVEGSADGVDDTMSTEAKSVAQESVTESKPTVENKKP